MSKTWFSVIPEIPNDEDESGTDRVWKNISGSGLGTVRVPVAP